MKNLKIIVLSVIATILLLLVLSIITYDRKEYIEKRVGFSKAEIPEKTYKFGKISVGDTVKHNFKIRNVGTNPIVINRIEPSCNCTIVNYYQNVIPVNKEIEIESIFVPTVKNIGENVIKVYVEANFSNKVIELQMIGIVDR